MAVAYFYGKDSNAYGVDISRIESPEALHAMSRQYDFHRENSSGFNEDGLILFIPEMNRNGWWLPDNLQPFFVHCPFEAKSVLGDEWTPFINRVSAEFNWNCFTVNAPKQPERYIYYKSGAMPREPELWDARGLMVESFPDDFKPVKQGGIVYWNHELWKEVNTALARHNNPEPFIRAVQQRQIWI